jgi:mannose-6-phosphate isomerase-like protein (cupin superfamily)
MPPGKISIDSASHYTWGQGCDGWHLVRTAELSIIEERMPPRTSEVRHHHTRSRQFFYVLKGEAVLALDGSVVRLQANEGLEIPPGISHHIVNESAEEISFLVISQPPSHGDRVMAGP